LPINVVDIIPIAIQAGQVISEVYSREDHGTVLKENLSPLTHADTASHNLIVEKLQALTPDIPILSEESKEQSYNERKNWRRFWLVDPLDGTKEFVKRNGEFVVNIALIEGAHPILGIIHAPVTGCTYYAQKQRGAYLKKKSGETKAIRVDVRKKGMTVIVSRSHSSPEADRFLSRLDSFDEISLGSALKFCLVAEGKAHLYPRFWPSMEWDTAAGHILIEEAGGSVTDLASHPLRYNKPDLHSPFFIASAHPASFISTLLS